jgi:YD repeat-containing protein
MIFVDAEGKKFERITTTKPALQQSSISEYNSLGQLVKSINAKQEPTIYTYDAVGNCKSVTDAKQHKTEYKYDKLNRNDK